MTSYWPQEAAGYRPAPADLRQDHAALQPHHHAAGEPIRELHCGHVTSPDQSQVFASFLTGTLASYEQNPAMYGTFTLINGMLGASVFFFHCTGNERVTLTHVHWTRWTKYFRWEPCWWRHTRKLSKRRSSNVDTFDQTKNYVDTEIPKILICL